MPSPTRSSPGTSLAGEHVVKEKILVIGHSHMNALAAVDGAAADFDFVSFPVAEKAYQRRDPDEFKTLAAADHAAVVFMLGGSTHVNLGMLNPPEDPFDFYLPQEGHVPFNRQARLLPVDLVMCLLKRHLKEFCDYQSELAILFTGHRLFHVESPPPCPAELIMKHPGGFAERLRERGLAPTAHRYKFWRLQSKAMREYCAACDMHYVSVPPDTQDADGCLAAPYLREDPTHANSAYGLLVLEQLRALSTRVS